MHSRRRWVTVASGIYAARKAGTPTPDRSPSVPEEIQRAIRPKAMAPGPGASALGLIARWIFSGTDGDLSGVGVPAFLAAYMPLATVTHRRRECIYAACPHYPI